MTVLCQRTVGGANQARHGCGELLGSRQAGVADRQRQMEYWVEVEAASVGV